MRVVFETKTELAGGAYHATADELEAIDEGLAGKAASNKSVKAAFARFR